jgi:octaprenyl-diphosphate synthase
MNIDEIRGLVADDMSAVDELVKVKLASEVALINQLGHYITHSGGKRLRPLLVVLAARASGYEGDKHLLVAAIIEFIHTATLLHDDVVDASEMRRGQEAANVLFGNEAAVLVGDFLYSRAFQMMVEVGGMAIMEILSDTTNAIAEGEVMQLMNCHDPDTSQDRYLDVIHYKTAKLFQAATRLGSVLARRSVEQQDAMAAYGLHLGKAFQLVDDVLDYSADSKELGKNVGDDLAEGKPTLPLIYAMRHGTDAQAALIRSSIEEGGQEHIAEIIAAIESTGALAYTQRLARDEADSAIQRLSHLPASSYRDALEALARYAVDRRY